MEQMRPPPLIFLRRQPVLLLPQTRHQILRNVFHVQLHSHGMQRLVVLQEFEIIRAVLKMSLHNAAIR
jgi:hypothetical protein